MKKTVSLIITVTLLLTMFTWLPQTGLASNPSGKCGDNVTWSIDPYSKTLTLSGTGETYDFGRGYLGPVPWSAYSDEIKSVYVEKGITGIGACLFLGLTKLTAFSLPDGLKSIGPYAVAECEKLCNIIIPASVTYIGEYAFADDFSLATADLPDGITSISEGLFLGCTQLKEVVIPPNTASIGDSAFWMNENLSDILIHRSVKKIGNDAFRGCSALNTVSYNGIITEWTAIDIKSGNEALNKADIYILGDSCGENVSWSFSYDNRTLTLSGAGSTYDFDGRGRPMVPWYYFRDKIYNISVRGEVSGLGKAVFANLPNLSQVVLGDSVEKIDENAFIHCPGLNRITIPDSVKSIGDSAFWGCGLQSVTLSKSLTEIEGCVFSHCSVLKEITIPSGVRKIGYGAFACCSSLSSVTIPLSVTALPEEAFEAVGAHLCINYEGSKEDWDKISGTSGNFFKSVTINFNCFGERIESVGIERFRYPTRGMTSYAYLESLKVPDGAHYSIKTSCWDNATDSKQMSNVNKFETGKEYYLTVELKADPGYYFSADCTAYINGTLEPVDRKWSGASDDSFTEYTLYSVNMNASQALSVAGITGYTEPKHGVTVSDNLSKISVSPGSGYYIADKRWRDAGTDETVSPYDCFEGGKTYYLDVTLRPENGYVFYGASGFINSAKTLVNANKSAGYWDSFNLISNTVTVKAPAAVTSVTVTGYKMPSPGMSAKDASKGISVSGNANYTISDISWIDYNKGGYGGYMEPDDTFAAGGKYSLEVVLTCPDNYVFAGNTACFLYGTENEADPENCCNAFRGTYYRLWSYPFVLKDMNLYGADAEGFFIPYQRMTVYQALAGIKAPDGANYTLVDSSWYNETEERPMDDDDTFNDGDFYRFKAIFRANPGYSFSDPDNAPFAGYLGGNDEYSNPYMSYIYSDGDVSYYALYSVQVQAEQGGTGGFTPAPGDINGDDEVGNKDVLTLRRYLAGMLNESEIYIEVADVDGDGDISNKDVLTLRRYLAGVIELPLRKAG